MNTNQKDKDFIDYKMYHGKSSKNVWTPVIWGAVIGVCLILFGVYEWYKLNEWEQTGGVYKMQQSLWSLYRLGGKNLVGGLFVVVGVFVIIKGYLKTKALKKLASNNDSP